VAVEDGFWNREELYQRVWSTPMRTIAQEYGISDVGLAKVCRKLMIPLPGRGYWAKKEAGQSVKRLPLPPIKDKIFVRRPAPCEEKPSLHNVGTDEERSQIERLERSGGEFVLIRGSLSHPLIVQARAVLGRATSDNRKILGVNEQCLDIRVSRGSLDRALRLMAGLIGTLEAEGFTVTVGNGYREHTVVSLHGQQITFGLVEKVDRVEQAVAPRGGMLERVLTYGGKPVTFEPAGRLSIEVWQPWHAHPKRWKDRKSSRLEDLLPQVVAGFVRIALAERAEKERRATEEQERQRRVEERAQLEQLIKTEQSRVHALRRAAMNWFRAQQVRSFLTAARDSARQGEQPSEPGTPFGDWLAWAEQQADRLDPLKESPASILDCKREVEPAYVGYYGYQKPDPPFRFPKPIWRVR
jgi:hypothetical protein